MIYFLVPVYNEAENIPELAQGLKSSHPDEHKFYVFVDDCSTDGSTTTIKEHFSPHSFVVLEKDKNAGPGDSFNRGFEWIINHSGDADDIIVTIEADNTSDLTILPDMINMARRGFDLVLASVYAQGGGFDKTTMTRKLLSFSANIIFRFLFDVKVLTLSSFYRVYRMPLIRAIKASNHAIIEEHGFICMLEILLKAIKLNARILEIPMILQSLKRKGKSKMKTLHTMWSYFKFLIRHKSGTHHG